MRPTSPSPPSPPPPPCWIFKPDANLEGSWNTAGEKMCKWRFGVLSEAMAACETEPNCDGVTRDGGVNCPIEGADMIRGNWSSEFLPTFRFRYHCRSAPAKRWSGMHSWVRTKGPCVETPLEDVTTHRNRSYWQEVVQKVPPRCPVQTAMRAATATPRRTTELAARRRRLARLERRSALETRALDDEEVRQKRCPSETEMARVAEQLRPPSCPAVLPLIAELALLPPRGLDEVCRSDCTIEHAVDEFRDGWGAQQYRRGSLFLAAAQLGCTYLHAAISTMDPISRRHGVKEREGENFFGLRDYCRRSGRPPRASIGCEEEWSEPLGPNLVDEVPARESHALAALCNATAGQLIDEWRRRVSGLSISCVWALRTPPVSRCAWLRAIAKLRHQYQTAQGGSLPALPWYDTNSDSHGDGGNGTSGDDGGSGTTVAAAARRLQRPSSPAPAPLLSLDVAVHIRRGDIRALDRGRYTRTERWSSLVRFLGPLLAEVSARWMDMRRPGQPALRSVLHVMSSSDYDKPTEDQLPLEPWRVLLEPLNVTLRAHVDADTLSTMRHLIGADVLFKSASSFSDTASLYSVGLKLAAYRSRDAPRQLFELHPTLPQMREDGAREEFVCTLLAHLAWKARVARVEALDHEAREM